MHPLKKLAAALTLAAFTSASLAQTSAAPETPKEAEGKVVWGLLIKLAAPYVFDFFAGWVKKKIAANYGEGSMERLLANTTLASIVFIGKYMAGKDIVLVGAAPNAGAGEPEAPLTTGKDGENYQGVNVTLVSVDGAGQPSGYRNVAEGFKTGERFKIKVLSTFDAMVVLGNIPPKGSQRQIYPAASGQAIAIPAGKEILLPLGRGEYLQFAGNTGNDQLTLTVRDPRSLSGGQAATARVFRKDEEHGSNFIQEVKPGQYPVISEAIGIQHR